MQIVRRAPALLLSAGLVACLLIAPASHAAGGWVPPIRGAVINGFWVGAADWEPGHRGLDLAGLAGQEVAAAAAGVVTFAGDVAGRGVVVISHGSKRSTYEPVLPLVFVGQKVAAGDPIGALQPGHPCAAPACLHFGLRVGEGYLDPRSVLWPTARLLSAAEAAAIGVAAAVPTAEQAETQGAAWHPIFGLR